MYILGFETTGPIGSVALLNLESKEIKMKCTDEPMSHLKNTAPLAHELLEEEGLIGKMDRIQAVAVSVGPGSFTGIRIGVTLAKSFALALQIPVIPIPTLSVFKDCIDKKPVSGILNARRGQVYGVVYSEGGDEIMKAGPYMLDEVLKVTDEMEEVIFYGDGVDAYEEVLKKHSSVSPAPLADRYQRADKVVRLAEKKWDNKEYLASDDLLPDYMRMPEAEQKLMDGTLKKQRENKMKRFLSNLK